MINRAIAILALAALASSASAELITNGGFETGNLSDYSSSLYPFSGISADARTGAFGLTFKDGTAAVPNDIMQHVALVPGGQYHLELWVYNAGVGDDGMTIIVDDQTAYDLSPTDFSLESWNLVSFDFTADANNTNDRFTVSGWDTAGWLSIDDMSLTAVPAPGATMVLGLASLAAGRRRR